MSQSQGKNSGNDQITSSSIAEETRPRPENKVQKKACKYPGIETVIHGNGAVAHVMGHVCGGVIGYPITPSTEISELFEAFRARGGCNV